MSLQVLSPESETTSGSDDRLDYARQILRAEAASLELVSRRIDSSFLHAVELIARQTHTGAGRVAVGRSAAVRAAVSHG